MVNITIPLYEINVGDIKIPISISYHASGIKVNELPGWVGQGWSLNAEPSISRSIQMKTDTLSIMPKEVVVDKFYLTNYLQVSAI